jgi:hypothetical protein
MEQKLTLSFEVLLPQPPECCDYRCAPPRLAAEACYCQVLCTVHNYVGLFLQGRQGSRLDDIVMSLGDRTFSPPLSFHETTVVCVTRC